MKNLILILCILFTSPLFAKTLQGRGPNGSANYENFILSGNAELVATGVRKYRDGTSAVPTTCAGTSPDGVSVDRVKSSAMSDDFHWMVFKSAVDSVGSGIAVDFELSRSAVIPGNQIEIGGIIKDFVAGAFGDGSPFKVFIYDRGKSQLLNSFDGSSVFKQGGAWARWFTPSDSRQYTLCFHVTSSIVDPMMVGLDDMYAKIKGPDVILYQEENTFTAQVSRTGTIIRSVNGKYFNPPFPITDISLFQVKFKGLNNTPLCELSPDEETGSNIANVTPQDGTQTKDHYFVRTNVGTAKTALKFTITCTLVGSDRKSPNVVTPADTFSTDTANLTYASSAQYTLATLPNAPVGTFITFTYAANTNTRVQTTTAPTQTTADMRLNGMRIYARAHNAASTAALPSYFAVQIGNGFKGYKLSAFSNTGKIGVGSVDSLVSGLVQVGMMIKEYDDVNGILHLDAGISFSGTTAHTFLFQGDNSLPNAYLVINASKNPVVVAPRSSSDVNNVEWIVGYDYIDKKDIWKRCHKVLSDITTGTIITWPANLSPTALNYYQDRYVLQKGGETTSESVIIHYSKTTGDVKAFSVSTGMRVGAGTKFCMEYTKP